MAKTLEDWAVFIQKNIRGFLARNKLIATNERYAKIDARKANGKLIVPDFFSILDDYQRIVKDKEQAPSPDNLSNEDLYEYPMIASENENQSNSSLEMIENQELEIDKNLKIICEIQFFIENKVKTEPFFLSKLEQEMGLFKKPVLMAESCFCQPLQKIVTEKKEYKALFKIHCGLEIIQHEKSRNNDKQKKISKLSLTLTPAKNNNFTSIPLSFSVEKILTKPICVIDILHFRKNKPDNSKKIVNELICNTPSIKSDEMISGWLTNNSSEPVIKNIKKKNEDLKIKLEKKQIELVNVNNFDGFLINRPETTQNYSPTVKKYVDYYHENANKIKLPAIPMQKKQPYITYRDYGFISDNLRKKSGKYADTQPLRKNDNKSNPYNSKWLEKYLTDVFNVKIKKDKNHEGKLKFLKTKNKKIDDFYKK